MYSTQIARDAGKSDDDCEKVYFSALLHDVGKIGVPDAIINKDGKLTDEESRSSSTRFTATGFSPVSSSPRI